MTSSTRPTPPIHFGRLEVALQALIVLSLVAMAFETLPDLTAWQRDALHWFEVGSVAIFTVEYLARAWLTKPWRGYVFSFFGVIDLLAILPFYIALGTGGEQLRALRLLRLFRILKLARYNTALLRFYRALVIAPEELLLFGAMALLLLYVAGVGVYQFEHAAQPKVFASVFDGMWWALCTLTTVGYGDVYPITVGGKLFTFLILVIGLGVVAVPVGLVASALTLAREQIEREMRAEAGALAQLPVAPSQPLPGLANLPDNPRAPGSPT